MNPPTLHHVPSDPQIPWQWWAAVPWVCEYTGKESTYLAGLLTRENAIEYGKRKGWTDADDAGNL